jgi:epoxyqueuosine reductase
VIPEEYRTAMGNRIYGCDDCQLACPWNRFASYSQEMKFSDQYGLSQPSLLELFQWSEEDFLTKLQGSPIRRIGYEPWLRNISIALGNASASEAIVSALKNKLGKISNMLDEHILWALGQQANTDKEGYKKVFFKGHPG